MSDGGIGIFSVDVRNETNTAGLYKYFTVNTSA